MGAESPHSSVAAHGDELQHRHASSDADTSIRDHETIDNISILNQVNEAALAAAFQESIAASPSELRQKEKSNPSQDPPAVEESTEARIERLGRQRPEAFDSIWSEIGFVFSISMSQVLSVGVSTLEHYGFC